MTRQERNALGDALSGKMERDLELLHYDPKLVYLMVGPETSMTESRITQMERDLELLGYDPRLVWIMQTVSSEAAIPRIEFIDRETVGALGAMAVKLGARGRQLQRIMRRAMLVLP